MSRAIYMSCVQYDQELRQGRVSVLDVAPVAARLGLAGVEYREVYWRERARELPAVREQVERLGLRATYATFTTLFDRDADARARLLGDVADAHALGSPLLRVFRGELPGDGPADVSVWDGARAALARAGELGLTLALENYARTPGNRLADVLAALAAFPSPVLGVNVDVSNYVLNGEDPIAAIRALAPRIRYAHLKDVKHVKHVQDVKDVKLVPDAGGTAGTPPTKVATYLSAGSLPYREILAELDAAGTDFPLCFEFGGEGDPEGALRQSLAYLAALAARPG